jgi:hippurate hydrolase
MGHLARPDLFEPLVNGPADIADAAAEVVGEMQVYRNRSLIAAAEDFAYILEARPGAFINIGNGDRVGSCPFRNSHYDCSDAASSFSSAARAPNIKQSTTITSGRLSEICSTSARC